MSGKKVPFGVKPTPQAPTAPTADQWVESRTAAETNKRLTLDIPASLHTRIKATCAQRGVKMADALRELLEEKFPA
jgi:predicted DNA binding CopG/RHH family protein